MIRQENLSARLSSFTLLDGYIALVGVVSLCITYLDLANYYHVLTVRTFLPKYAYFALGAAIIPLFFLRSKVFWRYLHTRFALWAAALVLLNIIHLAVYAIHANAPAAELVLTRIQFLVLAAALGFVLIQMQPVLLGGTFVVVALVLTALQVVDFLNVGMLLPLGTEGVVVGRAGSTLINSNKAAQSLILLMTFGIVVLRPVWRIWFVLIVFFGVFLSFSRSGLIAWAIIVAGAFWLRLFPRNTYWIGLIILPFAISAVTMLSAFVFSFVNVNAVDNIYGRLMFFLTFEFGDDSSNERFAVANYAIEIFFRQPFFGHGAGFTYLWDFKEAAPHNMNLLLLAEYGVVGYLLFLWLIILIFLNRGYFISFQTPNMTLIALSVFLTFSMFTHNMFDNLFWLVSIVILCQRAFYCPK
jgi:hypothetical protein